MQKFKKLITSNLVILLVYELLEEALEEILEEAIAFGITALISKTLTAIFAVTITQVTKVLIKRLIKRITQKEGLDKMEFIKKAGNRILKFIRENWQTGLGFASAVYIVLEFSFSFIGNKLIGAGISPAFTQLILIPLYGLIVNGLGKQGFEIKDTFTLRKDKEAKEKFTNQIAKEKSKLILETNKAKLPVAVKKLTNKELKAKHLQEIRDIALKEIQAQQAIQATPVEVIPE